MWHRTQIGNLTIRRSVNYQNYVRGDKIPFSSVFRFSSQEISWNCTPYLTVIWYSRCRFGCDRSVMQDTLPQKQTTSWWCLGFCCGDFPINSHLSLYVNLLKTMCGVLPIIKIKVGYLKSCVTGRLYLMSMYNCSWIFTRRYTYILYKQCYCSCNQPHIECNLLER